MNVVNMSLPESTGSIDIKQILQGYTGGVTDQ